MKKFKVILKLIPIIIICITCSSCYGFIYDQYIMQLHDESEEIYSSRTFLGTEYYYSNNDSYIHEYAKEIQKINDSYYINDKLICSSPMKVDMKISNTVIYNEYIYTCGIYEEKPLSHYLYQFDLEFNYINSFKVDVENYSVIALRLFYDGVYMVFNDDTHPIEYMRKVYNNSLSNEVIYGDKSNILSSFDLRYYKDNQTAYHTDSCSYFADDLNGLYKFEGKQISKIIDSKILAIIPLQDSFDFYFCEKSNHIGNTIYKINSKTNTKEEVYKFKDFLDLNTRKLWIDGAGDKILIYYQNQRVYTHIFVYNIPTSKLYKFPINSPSNDVQVKSYNKIYFSDESGHWIVDL